MAVPASQYQQARGRATLAANGRNAPQPNAPAGAAPAAPQAGVMRPPQATPMGAPQVANRGFYQSEASYRNNQGLRPMGPPPAPAAQPRPAGPSPMQSAIARAQPGGVPPRIGVHQGMGLSNQRPQRPGGLAGMAGAANATGAPVQTLSTHGQPGAQMAQQGGPQAARMGMQSALPQQGGRQAITGPAGMTRMGPSGPTQPQNLMRGQTQALGNPNMTAEDRVAYGLAGAGAGAAIGGLTYGPVGAAAGAAIGGAGGALWGNPDEPGGALVDPDGPNGAQGTQIAGADAVLDDAGNVTRDEWNKGPGKPGGGVNPGGGTTGDPSYFGKAASDIASIAGRDLSAVTSQMNKVDQAAVADHYGQEYGDVAGMRDNAKRMMDPAAAQAAEDASRAEMRDSIMAERNAALRRQGAMQAAGGASSSGGATGIYNTSMNALQSGERGLTQDAFGRKMQQAQAAQSMLGDAYNAGTGLKDRGFTSNKELMAMIMEAMPDDMSLIDIG